MKLLAWRNQLLNQSHRDGFRPAGEVSSVQFSPKPPEFLKTKRVRGKRADGIRYENKGQERVLAARPLTYSASPWLKFHQADWDASSGDPYWLWCQPDGLDIDVTCGIITIVEFKLSHTTNAWWQTRELYEPVVRKLFSAASWRYSILEIVKWYEPDIVFPEELCFVKDLSFRGIRPGKFHLYIWNGRD